MPRHSDQHALDAAIRQSFKTFLKMAFAELEGGAKLLDNWHIDAIEKVLEDVAAGRSLRQIISIAPRHLKSILVSVVWVAWMLGHHPDRRFMCISYGEKLAEDHASQCLQIMQSDWFQRAFPAARLTRKAVLDFKTVANGGRLSTSVSGGVTGRGAHYIIMDDPMKAHEAVYSENAREEMIRLFDDSIKSRLNSQETGSIVLVMQRLHEADLAGEMLRRPGWKELRLPAIATCDERVALTKGRFYQRREGHALHPARQSLATLARLRLESPYTFAAQYQQDPVSRIGAFCSVENFGIFDDPPNSGTIIMSVDTAVKATVRHDWSVAIIACLFQGRYYVLDVMRRRLEYGDLKAEIYRLCRQYSVDRLLIEDTSSGALLIQDIRREAPDGVMFPIGVTATLEKVARFEAQASKIQAGMVVLPRTGPWVSEFVGELTGFPGGRHDDQADALAQMLANPPYEYEDDDLAGPEVIDGSISYDGYDPDPW